MDGIINIYKPTGMTSFDVVYKVKKLMKEKKVGHTGTLDPEACGVLPVCVGRATKLIDYMMGDKKTYRARLKLGIVTDTYDREGNVIEVNEVNTSEREIMDALISFTGEINQVPPKYSALKINGKRMYELARAGVEFEVKSRPVTIYKIDNVHIEMPYVQFDVECSKGTYIRSLCYDIGRKLGCGAYMCELERMASGQFTIENSVRLDDLTSENIGGHLISMEKALSGFDEACFNDVFLKLIKNGVVVKDPRVTEMVSFDKLYRVCSERHELVGLGKKDANGFKLVKLLNLE